MTAASSHLVELARRANSLYSLPRVAMEVVELTGQPQTNSEALKKCLERDPALVSKVLRVVNSSLFGLRQEVSDLTQALTLLGTKPLKLLVLGFSLPEELFADIAGKQLQRYWRSSLTRAVAARLISEDLWEQPGDEAFIAGLLQDIGILAMLNELRDPYTSFLDGVESEQCDLAALEDDVLGFDHRQLSAAMLAHWNLPARLCAPVDAPRDWKRLVRDSSPEGELSRIVHMAELLVQLVVQKRLSVLPDIMDAGQAFCSLTKETLTALVARLQPQVDQLAEVLSLELPAGHDYCQVLREAHALLAEVAEAAAGPMAKAGEKDDALEELYQESQGLAAAMSEFVSRSTDVCGDEPEQPPIHAHAAHERTEGERRAAPAMPKISSQELRAMVTSAARRCRMRRKELSLLLFEIGAAGEESQTSGEEFLHSVKLALVTIGVDELQLLMITDTLVALVMADYERRLAVSTAHGVIDQLSSRLGGRDNADQRSVCKLSVGSATLTWVPKNFSSDGLIDAAERCLYAARLGARNAVKSIEI